jgi:hypothetical protein
MEDTLPLDEMDSCCQKEMKEQAHKARVMRDLRKTDRSMLRWDMKQRAFGDARSCGCCSEPADYFLLLKLRQEVEAAAVAQGGDEEREDERRFGDEDEEEEEDEDDADFYAGLENCYLDHEVEALEAMKSRALAHEHAKMLGFGVHREVSVAHLKELVKSHRFVVLFAYNARSELQARINIHLETLAGRYVGTLFRRIDAAKPEARAYLMQVSDDACSSIGLFAFREGSVAALTTQVGLFGDDGEAVLSEVEKWLTQTHALSSDTDDALLGADMAASLRELLDGGDENEGEELQSYCDLAGCHRTFPHEHVTKGNGLGTLSSKAIDEAAGIFASPSFLAAV